MRKNFWINLLLVCVGIVIGTLVAQMTSGINALSWLSYGLDFGTSTPLSLDLNVLRLTFGINVNITLATVIFVCLSLILGRLILKK